MKTIIDPDVYIRICDKASIDNLFKKRLLKNPRRTIEEVAGTVIPHQFKIEVDDQTDESNVYLVIPQEPNIDELELSEDELELVAGGQAAGNTTLLVLSTVLCAAGYAGYKIAEYVDNEVNGCD